MSFEIQSEEKYYEDVIENRIKYNKYIDDNFTDTIKDIIVSINKYIVSKSLYKKSILWVGGGRAWGECINFYYPEIVNKISNIENASLTSGNYDIFLLSNSFYSHEMILEYINEIVSEIFNDKKQYKIIYGNMKPTVYPIDQENCTIFPCQSIIIELKNGEYKKKIVFYLESFLVDDSIKINDVYSILFHKDRITYLNPVGLLLFSSFINQKRTEKSINVDYYRTQLLNKLLPTNINKIVLNTYLNLFYNTKQYNKYIRNILIKEIIFPVIDLNLYEKFFIEKIRPYVNTFIEDLNKKLSNYQCSFFLVGGDAIRRYVPDILTKDYDYKIYINKRQKKTKNSIINTLIETMSTFVYYINEIIIDNNVNNIETKDININTCYTPDSLYKKQYRLRYIEKNKNFNIDLFSIDYITRIWGDYYKNSYSVTHNISMIDISIIEVDFIDIEYNPKYSTVVNVPSLSFLLDDIKKMYETYPENRYWDKKNIKDMYRFQEMSKKSNINMDLDEYEYLYLDTKSFINLQMNPHIKNYIEKFNMKLQNDTTYKHKMGFDEMTYPK